MSSPPHPLSPSQSMKQPTQQAGDDENNYFQQHMAVSTPVSSPTTGLGDPQSASTSLKAEMGAAGAAGMGEMGGGNATIDSDEIVSDHVHHLASSIYAEFESLLRRYGSGVVDGLMPLIVGMLETMDQLYSSKEGLEISNELIKQEQLNLLHQLDKEKSSRKLFEQRLMDQEFAFEEEREKSDEKIDTLESLVKMLENKDHKNQENVKRMEEKVLEFKDEYTSLQTRYSDLLRNRQQQPQQQSTGQNRTYRGSSEESGGGGGWSGNRSRAGTGDTNGRRGDEAAQSRKARVAGDSEMMGFDKEDFHQIFNAEEIDVSDVGGAARNEQEVRAANLASEISSAQPHTHAQQEDAAQSGTSAATAASSDETDLMHREFEILLNENAELVKTKHALNIVKDDLITQVDELTGENDLQRQEMNRLIQLKKKHKEKIAQLEHDLREVQEKLSVSTAKINELEQNEFVEVADKSGVAAAKFTKEEICRLLLERNRYKEELIELQEALRYQNKMLAAQHQARLEQMQSAAGGSSGGGGHASSLSSRIRSFITGENAASTSSSSSSPQHSNNGGGEGGGGDDGGGGGGVSDAAMTESSVRVSNPTGAPLSTSSSTNDMGMRGARNPRSFLSFFTGLVNTAGTAAAETLIGGGNEASVIQLSRTIKAGSPMNASDCRSAKCGGPSRSAAAADRMNPEQMKECRSALAASSSSSRVSPNSSPKRAAATSSPSAGGGGGGANSTAATSLLFSPLHRQLQQNAAAATHTHGGEAQQQRQQIRLVPGSAQPASPPFPVADDDDRHPLQQESRQ